MSEPNSASFTQGYEEFWRKPQKFADEAIRNSAVVLDTNAILNLYRMKPSARNEYLQVLQRIADRVWIPRQVADEFHKNRLSTVDSHLNSLRGKSGKVSEAADVLRSALRDFFKLHSLADGRATDYLEPLNKSISGIVDSIKREVEEYDLKPSDLLSGDPILERLAVLFDGKVGVGVSIDERKGLMEKALSRGKQGIPPGYKDVQKKGEEGVGDYFIWWEMIEYAKVVKKDVLFISTDGKEDWVREQCGFPIGPRPELVREMQDLAEVKYHHLPLAIFLSRAADVLKVQVSQDTIDQAKDRPGAIERRRLKSEILKRRDALVASEQSMIEIQHAVSELNNETRQANRRAAEARERFDSMRTSHSGRTDALAEAAAAEDHLRRKSTEYEAAVSALVRVEQENAALRQYLHIAELEI
ncbi:PIN-like domain-containing protein [Streptomyces phaeochromogenes]|uniref:PIN-like domain-containing protein n=1 Tax=Streptomyces phaeochromogenes TaxID=1923 RepID=UPI00386C0D22|nr:PIN domain-containing protein [Streptomyces phaeochromogenes]